MKSTFLMILLGVSTHSFSQNSNSHCTDSCFIKYLNKLDSTLTFSHSNIQKEEFVLWGTQIQDEKNITWVSFDKNYTVGLIQNFFESDDDKRISTIQLVVYSKKHNKLAIFINNNQESTSCRSYITLADILPYTVQCFVFNSHFQNEGDLYFQFFLKNNKSIYTFRKIQGEKVFKYSKPLSEFDVFNHEVYRLLDYDNLMSFAAMILKASDKYKNVDGPWKEVAADSHYVRYIDSLMKDIP